MPVPIAVAPRLTSRNRAAASRRRCDVLLHRGMKRIELLAERHRHRVLQLGAADLEHIGEFDRLGLEGIGKFLQRPHEGNGREDHGEAQRRRIGIVGRLRHVDVVDSGAANRYSPRRWPMNSSARLATTSLAFILVEVPAPPCTASTTN